MTDQAPQPIYLRDYKPPAYLITTVELTFRLDPKATRVISRIEFHPNHGIQGPFYLHGQELDLKWAKIDGQLVNPNQVDGGITCDVPSASFVWEAEVEIDPSANTSLEGLYMSGGMYCTQCEAEGFRKITYYPDRPDVMATFTVRIEGDIPVLLSNGNPVSIADGVAEWHDPWPKPAYLFALVAGDLIAYPDRFTTVSGRRVGLNIYVRAGDEGKCAFGMQALKASMKWDEDVYGREYDLDIFNIVAVDDFNAGAMENKGLNIFNSACVLASPETATDCNYTRIEAIIAHEYFHNWTGNRVTCRDWFQLCLKEGLTVFRDQRFTGDMRGHSVKRIDDAEVMRRYQFREDGGPLAHSVRPASVIEINNFYTATVYEKGAEVIGMLKRVVGDEAYYKACNLYFDRHDGEAATIEDWLAAFADTTGQDLTQFARWYSQAGTPELYVDTERDGTTLKVTLRQKLRPTPDDSPKEPLVIPVELGIIDADGTEALASRTLILSGPEQSFTFSDIGEGAVVSALRDFSAPVTLHMDQSSAERVHLLAHDTDPFNRYKAGQTLAEAALHGMVLNDTPPERAYLDGLLSVLLDADLDPSFRALILALPSQDQIASQLGTLGHVPDPDTIHLAHQSLKLQVAQHLQDHLPRIYADMTVDGPYSPDPISVAKRDLGNQMLSYLTCLDGGIQAARQFAEADNMTQQLAALAALSRNGHGKDQLTAFYTQWKDDRLVMDKWFGLQASCAQPETAAETVDNLTRHELFDWKNPNRFGALMGGLVGNAAGFHRTDGAGYRLLADWLIRLDGANPQTAARFATRFDSWKRYDPNRQAMMKEQLSRIANTKGLSRDTSEIVGRILA